MAIANCIVCDELQLSGTKSNSIFIWLFKAYSNGNVFGASNLASSRFLILVVSFHSVGIAIINQIPGAVAYQ